MTILAVLHQEIRVNFRYGVYFTQDLFAPHNPLLAEITGGGGGDFPRKLLFVVDQGLYRRHPRLLEEIIAYLGHHPGHLQLASPPLLVPGGERVKNEAAPVFLVRRAIQQAGLCRHSYVVAVGGGAVIDMAGYAAATAHRGLRLIRIPTTVMAQADASIGVKNSINAFGQKNFLGTFAPPWAVLNDCSFLTTLSRRDWLSGVAEALKVALIKDASFFAFLEKAAAALKNRDLEVMQRLIRRSAALHLDHIAHGGDPFESGSSRPLDFGHWAAHKLEQLSAFELRHGEAVAIGMALDATYSHLAGLLPVAPWRRILALLARLGLPRWAPVLGNVRAVLQGLQEFREHLGGRLTIMLLAGIGQPLEVHELERETVEQAIAILGRRAAGGVRQPATAGLAAGPV
ncbi:MAG: 3-dehydroquinate synthase [Deltaproteobacteria bacterium]|nr:MAG: 3-dehydroquinate synthase [Deltaproteobacteria bacterium]